MNNIYTFIILSMVLFLFACRSEQAAEETNTKSKANNTAQKQSADNNKKKNKNNRFVGTWVNKSMKLNMKTPFGRNVADSTVNVNEKNWEKKLGIKPIETTFKKNGTYISNYYSKSGNLLSSNGGKYKVKGNKITLTQKTPSEGIPLVYDYKFLGKDLQFKTLMDWDRDGETDDDYTGVQKRKKK